MNAPDFIQNIPLDKLVKSPRNVRRTPPPETAQAELKASIAVRGLQQNLVVAPANGDGIHEVTPEALGAVYAVLGVDADHALSTDDVWAAVMERGANVALAGGLSLRRARVMDAERFEVAGFPAGAVDQLKALGLMSEIITWRLRLFIPTTGAGVAVLGALIDRHPVLQCTARARA